MEISPNERENERPGSFIVDQPYMCHKQGGDHLASYLHEDCHQRIIHYDIKPGSVLLDQYFLPKVADFGLAKLCNRESTHVSFTGYRGTPGYSAPEFLLHNYPITHKCDVYSFGMLLFEMVMRQRNFQTRPVSEIIDWFPKKAWEEYEKGRLTDLIFQIGIEEKDKEKAERMFMTAFWCLQDSPDSRPLMSTVVKMLEGGVEILPPSNPISVPIRIRSYRCGH
ncbi:hypothetical protein MKX03_021038 [Papaver bracteatum]|nr:hypothetical protein MKX03_021038 [Papaver bracteatum]